MKRLHRIVSVVVLFSVSSFVGCSALLSSLDKIEPVHLHGSDITEAITPKGFVVTIEEVRSVVPITKYAWNVYADSENYYLSSAIQKLTSKSGDNSWRAGQNGIRIKGTERGDIDRLQNSRRTVSPSGLRELLGQDYE